MGWVLYREGKLDAAQSYIEAAWHGWPNPDVGEHLATIQTARGDKSAAFATYQMVLSIIPSHPPTERQKELQQKADNLRDTGAKAPTDGAMRQLESIRTLPLGASAGRTGMAKYRVLLHSGAAVKAEPAGDKTIPGAEEMIQKTDFGRFFPNGATASIVSDAFVNCHQDVCDLFVP